MGTSLDRREFIRLAAGLSAAGIAGVGMLPSTSVADPQVRPGGAAKLKTSLNAYSFNKMLRDNLEDPSKGISLLKLLDFCAEHDFDAIDPTGYFFPGYPGAPSDTYINNFKRRAFELGLDISGTGVKNNFADPDPKNRAADVERVKLWIEVAAKLGAPVIRVFAGPTPDGYENRRKEITEWMVKDLRTCVEYGKAYGVLVGVQNHGDFIQTAEQAIHIIERVNSEWFGLILDTGFFLTPDPYVDMAKAMPYAVNLQVKESPFGAASPIRIDTLKLMTIIRDSGYRGYCPIETLMIKGKEDQYDPYEKVSRFHAEVKHAMDVVMAGKSSHE